MKIELKECLCAFLDILGYKNIIKTSNLDQNIKNIEKIKEIFKYHSSLKNNHEDYFWKAKTFSDNIYLESKIKEHPIFTKGIANESNIAYLLEELAHYQRNMYIECEFFVRGGIVIGDVYSDEDIIYGKGIIDAVEEEKKAIYPRIVIAEKLLSVIEENRKCYGKEYWGDDIILQSEDGKYFLNYLNFEEIDRKALTIHKALIEDNLKKNNDEKILGKYIWLANYHNYFINNFGYFNPDSEEDERVIGTKELLINIGILGNESNFKFIRLSDKKCEEI